MLAHSFSYQRLSKDLKHEIEILDDDEKHPIDTIGAL
jgi:hypothetical protein